VVRVGVGFNVAPGQSVDIPAGVPYVTIRRDIFDRDKDVNVNVAQPDGTNTTIDNDDLGNRVELKQPTSTDVDRFNPPVNPVNTNPVNINGAAGGPDGRDTQFLLEPGRTEDQTLLIGPGIGTPGFNDDLIRVFGNENFRQLPQSDGVE